MIFSFFRRGTFLLLLLLSTSVWADTLTKEATYYSDSFDGGTTANGEKFSQNDFSAAICDMALGQYLYVSTGSTGIVVSANDRPNCRKYPDVIDLSREAFRVLSPLGVGRISGISVTSIGSASKTPKGFLTSDVFAHLGIILDTSIPTILFSGESIEIRGHVTDRQKNILMYLTHSSDTTTTVEFLTSTDVQGYFQSILNLPHLAGEYTLVIASGNSFNTDKVATITLIDSQSLVYPTLPEMRSKIVPIVQKGTSSYLSLPLHTWAELSVTQDGKTFKTSGTALSLEGISLNSGLADITLGGYILSTASPLDRSRAFTIQKSRIILDRRHENTGNANIRFKKYRRSASFTFTVPEMPRIRNTYYITPPDGGVEEYTFPKEYTDLQGLLIPGKKIPIKFSFIAEGSYQVEVVSAEGLAYINTSLLKGNVWPLLRPLSDDMIRTQRKSREIVVSSHLKKINTLRFTQNRNLVSLDPELTRLAQMKAEDMSTRLYAAHRDPDGNYIDGFAKKRGFTLDTSLGENIAYGNISDIALYDGLEESGSHRHNMLLSKWSKVGIGYSLVAGNISLVHIFSD